jgi:amidase
MDASHLPGLSRRDLLVVAGSGLAVAAQVACRRGIPSRVGRLRHREGDVLDWSAAAMAAAIQSRELSSEELVRACLQRIAAVNPKLNAVVQQRAEDALVDARSADAAVKRRDTLGPLHGVPMTIKDSLDTAGVISTAGTLGRASFVPERDATAVARLKKAGAILLGKTNTPEFTLYAETDNLVYGRTSNPYDVARIPGGSSGGAAAIVAAGGSPFDVGSDTGGSVRIPGHMCGLAALKPTSGRVPRTGNIISWGGVIDGWTQLGPITRFVEDLPLILPVIAGNDWRDPGIVDMPILDPGNVDIGRLSVAFHTDNGLDRATPEIVSTVQRVAAFLSEHGLAVREARPPVESTLKVMEVGGADGAAWLWRLAAKANTKKFSPALEGWKAVKPVSSADLTAGVEDMDNYRSRMLAFMETYDVIVCPVESYAALPHGAASKREYGGTYVSPYNISGQPAATVRAGTSADGMPIGIQIVGRHFREDVVLAVAQLVEDRFGGWKRPDVDALSKRSGA